MSVLRFALLSVIFLSSTLWASVGKVALLKGEAVAERNAQTITLQNGSLVEDKDAIKTGKDAQVQLLFEDKTVITLGSESEFKIEEYLNDATNPKAKFKFNQGTFKTITGQIGKTAPDNFKLETKTATIGIRGTIVKGSTGDKGDVIACLRGLITVMSRHTGAVVEVPAGQFTTIQSNTSPSTPQETKPGTTDNSLANNTPPPTSTAPTTVTSVEQTKNDTIVQNNYSPQGLQTGTLSLQGLTTSDSPSYFSYDLTFSINRSTAQTTGTIKSNSETTIYSLATPANGLSQVYTENGFTIASYIDLSTYDSQEDYAPNFAYYASDTLFLRGGFTGEVYPVGYFGSANGSDFQNVSSTANSQYVTWGVWGADYWYDSASLAGEQYWVAGPVLTDPQTLIALGSATTYTYNGQVLGKTYDGSSYEAIDTVNSNVVLNFKFGGTSNPIQAGSSISFTSDHGAWTINPAATASAISGNTFEALGTATVVPTITNSTLSSTTISDITGKVFGSNAQAVGGVFSTSTSNGSIITSTGVFKAVR